MCPVPESNSFDVDLNVSFESGALVFTLKYDVINLCPCSAVDDDEEQCVWSFCVIDRLWADKPHWHKFSWLWKSFKQSLSFLLSLFVIDLFRSNSGAASTCISVGMLMYNWSLTRILFWSQYSIRGGSNGVWWWLVLFVRREWRCFSSHWNYLIVLVEYLLERRGLNYYIICICWFIVLVLLNCQIKTIQPTAVV